MFKTLAITAALCVAATPAFSDGPWRQTKTSYGALATSQPATILDIASSERLDGRHNFIGFNIQPRQKSDPTFFGPFQRIPASGLRNTSHNFIGFAAPTEAERFQP